MSWIEEINGVKLLVDIDKEIILVSLFEKDPIRYDFPGGITIADYSRIKRFIFSSAGSVPKESTIE